MGSGGNLGKKPEAYSTPRTVKTNTCKSVMHFKKALLPITVEACENTGPRALPSAFLLEQVWGATRICLEFSWLSRAFSLVNTATFAFLCFCPLFYLQA